MNLSFQYALIIVLINAGIKRIIDLVNLSEDEGLKIKNFGRKSLNEVKEAMKSFGLSFGMNIKESDIKRLLEGKDREGYMKHQCGRKKLNRAPAHRRSLLRNQVMSLITYGHLVTTKVRAQEVRRFAEKLVTLGA